MTSTCCTPCALSANDFEYYRDGEDLTIELYGHPRIAHISVEHKEIMIELHYETPPHLYEQNGYERFGNSETILTKKHETIEDTVNEMIKLRDEITGGIKGDT